MGSRDLAEEAFFVLLFATPKEERGKWLAGTFFQIFFSLERTGGGSSL